MLLPTTTLLPTTRGSASRAALFARWCLAVCLALLSLLALPNSAYAQTVQVEECASVTLPVDFDSSFESQRPFAQETAFTQTAFPPWEPIFSPDVWKTGITQRTRLPNSPVDAGQANGVVMGFAAGNGGVNSLNEGAYIKIDGFQAGETYYVSFYYVNDGLYGPGQQLVNNWKGRAGVELKIGNSTRIGNNNEREVNAHTTRPTPYLSHLSDSNTNWAGNQEWKKYETTFVAQDTTQYLQFRGAPEVYNDGGYMAIDGINIFADPEACVQTIVTAKRLDNNDPNAPFQVGERIQYDHEVRNTGIPILTNVDLKKINFNGANNSLLDEPTYIRSTSSGSSPAGLLSGESLFYRSIYTVSQADIDKGTLVYQAGVTNDEFIQAGVTQRKPSDTGTAPDFSTIQNPLTTDSNGDLIPDNDPTVLNLRSPRPQLVLSYDRFEPDGTTPIANNNALRPGDIVRYRYKVTNPTGNTLSGYQLWNGRQSGANAPNGLNPNGGQGAEGFNGTGTIGGTNGITVGNLAPGGTKEFTRNYVLRLEDFNPANVPNRLLINQARVDVGGAIATASFSVAGTRFGGQAIPQNEIDGFFDVVGGVRTALQLPALISTDDITFVKSFSLKKDVEGDDQVVDAGDKITYTFVVTNNSSITAKGVSLVESDFSGDGTLPAPEFFSSTGGATATEIPGGASATFKSVYTLTQADIDKGVITNQAVVSADNLIANVVSDTGTAPGGDTISNPGGVDSDGDGIFKNDPTVATLKAEPSLSLVKTYTTYDPADNSVITDHADLRPGDAVEYTFVVRNTGNVTLNSVAVTDNWTSGSDINEGAPGFNGTGAKPDPEPPLPFNGTLAPGGSVTFTSNYELRPADFGLPAGRLINQANVTAVAPNTNSVKAFSVTGTDELGNALPPSDIDPTVDGGVRTELFIPASPRVNLLKWIAKVERNGTVLETPAPEGTTPAPEWGNADPGDVLHYVFEVENTGTRPLFDVVVAETSVFNGSGTAPAVNFDSSSQNSPEGELQVGETATYTATYTLVANDFAVSPDPQVGIQEDGYLRNQAVVDARYFDDVGQPQPTITEASDSKIDLDGFLLNDPYSVDTDGDGGPGGTFQDDTIYPLKGIPPRFDLQCSLQNDPANAPVAGMFLAQSSGSDPTMLYNILYNDNPFQFDDIGFTQGIKYNAMGFRPQDNYIYGAGGEGANNQLVRVGRDGSARSLGTIVDQSGNAIPNNRPYQSGDVHGEDGFLYILNQSQSTMWKVNVETVTAEAITLSDPAWVTDFAFNPKDRHFYGVQGQYAVTPGRPGTLVRIKTDGTVEYVLGKDVNGNDLTPNGPTDAGAMFADLLGNVYASSNSGTFYRMDLETGLASEISPSQPASGNDGASCPYGILRFKADPMVEKEVDSDTFVPGTTLTYQIRVENNGPFGAPNVAVSDPGPQGLASLNANLRHTVLTGNDENGNPYTTVTVSDLLVRDLNGDLVPVTRQGPLEDTISLLPPDANSRNPTSWITYQVIAEIPEDHQGDLLNTVTITPEDATIDLDTGNNQASARSTQRVGGNLVGRVFEDNGSGGGTPHDGQPQGSESGLAGVRVTLRDLTNITLDQCATAPVLAETTTDGDGNWGVDITDDISGTPVCLVAETPNGWRAVSEAAGTAGADITLGDVDDATMEFVVPPVGTQWEGILFGKVRLPSLVPDQQGSIAPGATVTYRHQFTAGTAGTVDFSLGSPTSTPATPAWGQTLWRDPSCSGQLDPSQALTGIEVEAGEQLCLVVQVNAPADAPVGAQHRVVLEANQTLANTAFTDAANVTDLTLVQDGQLTLEKRVRNIGLDGMAETGDDVDSGWTTRNEGQACEVLRYQIRFTNNGATPVAEVTVNDGTPAYTFLAAQAACPTNLPESLAGCTFTTPDGLNAPGYEGSLQWQFNGPLAPGAQGTVSYDVHIQGPAPGRDAYCR